MMSVAQFILAAGVEDPNLRFRWDDWGDEVFMMEPDEAVLARLEQLSLRASLAFSATAAEWIVQRFARLTDVAEPLYALEASWLQQINFLYSWDWSLDETWAGPIRGPVRAALDQVSLGVESLRDYSDVASSSAEVDKLAVYLLTDPTAYIRWRDSILDRFQSLYPLDVEDRTGDVVPRAATDPDTLFNSADTEDIIRAFMSNIDYENNPFLKDPETMLEDGFEGTPYRFNFADDRRTRLDW
jgi:hypothetical protein